MMGCTLTLSIRLVLAGSLASAVGFSTPSVPKAHSVARSDAVQRVVLAPTMVLADLQEEVQLLRAELIRKDAIIKGLLGTLETTAITTDSGFASSSTPLQDLCQISKEACDTVTPMLRAFYEKISDQRHGGSSKLKSDATYFTIADGIVQHMFIKHLFAGNKFAQIVGEEDESVINILEKPYSVDDLTVPDEFNSIIAATLKEIDQLAARIDPNLYKTMTVFVDPIDGTREFATAQGEYVTILIGYNDAIGHPSAGIMYRPLTTPVTWAAGAASEEVVMGELDMADPPVPNGMLITDGKVSPFIVDLIDELGYERVSSVASGNRAMMLLEGKGGAYIRDTGGFAKWDTSAPTAVLEAYGGTMSKLPPFLEDESLVGYTHLKSEKNLDFVPGQSTLTLSNIKDKSAFVKGSEITTTDVDSVKAYSCMQGLVAVDKAAIGDLPKIREAMQVVMEAHKPTYT